MMPVWRLSLGTGRAIEKLIKVRINMNFILRIYSIPRNGMELF